jgi:hypothetical protein
VLSLWTFEETDRISLYARKKGISPYDIFVSAGDSWGIPMGRIKEDFKQWLKSGCDEDVPFYVRWYIRNVYGS